MKFVVSTHVPVAGSCSHLSCWTEAHPALWRELTSTQTSIWLSRQQLLPTSWPNKWVILEADHWSPPLPCNPLAGLWESDQWLVLLGLSPVCLRDAVDFVDLPTLNSPSQASVSHDGLSQFRHHPEHNHERNRFIKQPNDLEKKCVNNISPIPEKLITQPQKILPSNTI